MPEFIREGLDLILSRYRKELQKFEKRREPHDEER
jgi:hypothetical protein